MKYIYKIKTFVYCVGMTLLIATSCNSCCNKERKQKTTMACNIESSDDESGNTSDFWPPDIVPHPMPPWEDPRDQDPPGTPEIVYCDPIDPGPYDENNDYGLTG